MKRLFKSFTFYFMLFSILLIYNQYIGYDSKNIILISFNVILNNLFKIDSFREIINSGPTIKTNTLFGETSVYLYICHFITFIIYGLFLDFIKRLLLKTMIEDLPDKDK
ncbi:hypothetical protein SAMN02194393_02222 [Maledivibacter halophilus]|uniref:Uncharacterized protein n=1 Tax=Maledivibacter halophilus TaxID=36842 RepID=A0A1T5KZX8_9FIRM|nr:hypothetical protein SAMN02194393_02222 [Maledivibacter halophilus]